MDINCFIEALKEKEIEFLLKEKMADYTTFKIGGPADVLCFPKDIESLKYIISYCRKSEIPFFVLGNGSNLLVSDDGIEGVVISLKYFDSINKDNALEISCEAGVKLSKLCSFALENCLSGLEFAWGIPGTVGGAIYMNAGAYGGEISCVLQECTYIDETGAVIQADVSGLQFGYRKSIFSDSQKIIISAKFRLLPERRDVIKSQMDDLLQRRKDKQPLEYPSAGSTFKRPAGHFAGTLIEKCELKGTSVGGAQVSQKHAGFVINKGGATCRDVLSLISKIKEDVFLKESVTLEPEVKIIGRL